MVLQGNLRTRQTGAKRVSRGRAAQVVSSFFPPLLSPPVPQASPRLPRCAQPAQRRRGEGDDGRAEGDADSPLRAPPPPARVFSISLFFPFTPFLAVREGSVEKLCHRSRRTYLKARDAQPRVSSTRAPRRPAPAARNARPRAPSIRASPMRWRTWWSYPSCRRAHR